MFFALASANIQAFMVFAKKKQKKSVFFIFKEALTANLLKITLYYF